VFSLDGIWTHTIDALHHQSFNLMFSPRGILQDFLSTEHQKGSRYRKNEELKQIVEYDAKYIVPSWLLMTISSVQLV
jgi:hypothetical protein